MVLEIPFIQAFSMENVQAFEFADHLRAEDWFKAYHAAVKSGQRRAAKQAIMRHHPQKRAEYKAERTI
jgi:hypothetical protein